jgi:hypothetical protein
VGRPTCDHPALAVRVDPIGLLPRRLIVIGAAGIITNGAGGVIDAVAVGVGAVINVVVVDGIGIIGVICNITAAAVLERSQGATDQLNATDHRQDVALRPDVAAGGALELAAQDGLDGRHRNGMAVLHHDGRAVGLVQRQVVKALGRRPARPSARIAGLTLPELRMPGRLAVADLIGGGCRLGGGHDGSRLGRGTGQSKERGELKNDRDLEHASNRSSDRPRRKRPDASIQLFRENSINYCSAYMSHVLGGRHDFRGLNARQRWGPYGCLR